MARKSTTDELIHCSVCGEDYSSTYRRCPFCGERADARPSEDEDFDDGYVFDGQALFDDPPADSHAPAGKGGKRLAAGGNPAPKSGGSRTGVPMGKSKTSRYDPPGAVNWVRLITFGISLVIIIAALIIVFTVIYPMIHTPDVPDGSSTPGTSTVDPGSTDTPSPDPGVTDDPSPSPIVTDEPTPDPGVAATIVNAAGGLNVRSGPGTTYNIQDSLKNGDSVTILEVDGSGWYKISYVGKSGQETTGYVKGDYVAAKDGGDTPAVEPSPEPTTSPSGTLKPGTKGKITGAAGGLRVRSGPGTTYDILASLVNGNEITVLEDAGNGWYKIAYSGENGKETTGYIMGTYISAN